MKPSYSAILIVFCACFLCLNAVGQTHKFEVTQYPEAAYINEQNLFVVKTQPETKVEIYLDDKKLHEHVSSENTLEINLILTDSGLLRFQQGDLSISFHLVQPSDDPELNENKGYLYSKKGPAILLMEHLHPPKHSRKWETVKIFLDFFKDTRPEVTSGTLIKDKPKGDIAHQKTAMTQSFPERFWQHIEVTNTVTWINGLAAIVPTLDPADVAVVAMAQKDLERGIDEIQLRLKLEWCLQALRHRSFKYLLVIPPHLSGENAERFPNINASISLSAAGNGAHFISIPPESEAPSSKQEWLHIIAENMKTWLKW
ncbi:MAG: hypothetical protein KAH23_01235 [Kiritimatiellae bacterium]|nr:hypothetical protein [Kiritimatiellia bacterium]